MSKKCTLEEIKLELKNIEIFSTEYVNNFSHLDCRCKICNHEWKGTWKHLKRGVGCPKCKNSIKLSIGEIKKRLTEMNSKIQLISEHYINSGAPLEFQCDKSHRWFTTWDQIKQGAGCSICARENHPGHYSIKMAEKNKEEWILIEAHFYILRCFNEEEEFFKVGVTKNSIKKRYPRRRMPYNYEIIADKITTLYDAIEIETRILKENKEYQYIPKIYFEGYSECLTTVS